MQRIQFQGKSLSKDGFNLVSPSPPPPPPLIVYGMLYSWYTVTSTNSMFSDGWDAPSTSDWEELSTFLGGDTVSGGKLKETGTVYWDTNIDASNSSLFFGRGSGIISGSNFLYFKESGSFWSTSSVSTYNGSSAAIDGYNDDMNTDAVLSKGAGLGVRAFRPSTGSDPVSGSYCDPYIGNDGYSYNTIRIGNQVFTTHNLIETKYRDGSPISYVADSYEWNRVSLGTKQMIPMNDDINNAYIQG